MDLRSRFSSRFDDEDNDSFEGPSVEQKKEQEVKEKKQTLSPDNPEYWEQDEPKWEHLRVSNKNRFYLWLTGIGVLIGLCIAFYLRFCSPYIEDATAYGYVDHIEKRGTIFKTYEGTLINYKELHDTTRLYKRDFVFTAGDVDIASKLKRMQIEGKPVRVEYKMYHATLPWRGSSKIIITSVDSVNPRTILPPEFQVETE